MAEIVLDGVTKQYPGGAWGLKTTDLTVGDGEFFILVGPSGCGKSTLLNMIVGLEEPSAGEIRVDGRRVNEVDPKDRNMAMVFQSYALYPHLTVRDNIAFPLKLAKRPRHEIRDRVAQTAEILQLTALLERKPHMLSGGQRQRVAMGRAIVRDPDVFLMDEPLSNLDARLRLQMRTEIARLQQRLGITTLYVTHDQTEAMTLGDRVAVLNEGEVQQVGTPQALYREPANRFVAGFIGSPGMNFVPAVSLVDAIALPFARLPTSPLRPPGGPGWVAGVRPEDLKAPPPPGSVSFPMRVEVLEWLGAEAFAHGRTEDGTRLIARLQPDIAVHAGDVLELGFDAEKVHLFDAAGRKLRGADWTHPVRR